MPLYEVELQRQLGGTEVRLTDRALAVGDELRLAGRRWLVESMVLPEQELSATVRYVCRELGLDGDGVLYAPA
jgi:hypothetical protein